MIKFRVLIFIALAAVIFLGATALARAGGQSSNSAYVLEQTTASGMGYHLTNLDWRVTGTASGDGYQLLDVSYSNASPPPSLQTGCCCTYLPCIQNNN